MAMTKCKECGAEVSTKADACPRCGAKPKKGSGCALVVLGFLVVFLVVVVGGQGSRSRPQAPTAGTPSTAPTPPAPTVEDTAARVAQEKQALAEVEQRIKGNAAKLGKFYASPEQVKQASDDIVRLAIIKGMYGDSKVTEERALSQRAERLIPKVARQSRELYASTVAEIFVKSGMDARVSAVGGEKKTLRIAYALMSQPLVYKFQNDIKLDEQARYLGFSKLIYTDGFGSSLGKTWAIDLK